MPTAAVGYALGCPNVPKLGKPVKPKKKCCQDRPRCKKCPAVLKKLSNAGYAEKLPDGRFVVIDVVPKKALKAARAR